MKDFIVASAEVDAVRHKNEECRCYVSSVQQRCSYEMFPDGWSFVHDVGNGQVRGEVFTPRHLVEQMLVSSGLLHKDLFSYDGSYSLESPERQLEIVEASVCEPAVGTGNFITTVLWHKIGYAAELAITPEHLLDVGRFEELLVRAVASVFMFDIDAGNLQTVKRRILSDPLTKPAGVEEVAFWADQILNLSEKQGIEPLLIKDQVRHSTYSSLAQAFNLWNRELRTGGLVDRLYFTHVGETIPDRLRAQLKSILDGNVLLFNALSKTPTVTEGAVIPGWDGVCFLEVSDIKWVDGAVSFLSYKSRQAWK